MSRTIRGIIDPREQHIAEFDEARKQGFIRCFTLIERAASLAIVPCHFAVDVRATSPQAWLVGSSQSDKPRIHALGTSGPSWSTSGIEAALTTENRSCLILRGFWLETSVTFVALCALSSGFDVYVLADATPSHAEQLREPSFQRLIQAGVVPLTTHQLIAEWAEQNADANLRSSLLRLIQPG